MILKTKNLIILLLLILSVSSYYIIPLRAATIKITDQELRLTKKIHKMIDINLTKEQYIAHKDTQVIVSITSLAIDQHLNFYFQYDIMCPNVSCYLNFTLIRKNQRMNEKFMYSITADYLVARGLRVFDINITEFQTHIQLKTVRGYNQNNQLQYETKVPRNNQDAFHMLMFPCGFTNISLTGYLIYNYVISDHMMYVIHYQNHNEGHDMSNDMGWLKGIDNVRYRAVFVPPSYLNSSDCLPTDKTFQQNNYKLSCNGKHTIKWFYGFKGTTEQSIQGEFIDLKSGFSFSLANSPSNYGLVAFPFESNDQFIDKRVHDYKWDVQKQEIKRFVGLFLLFSLIIGIVVAVKCANQKYSRAVKIQKRRNSDDMMQSTKAVYDNQLIVSSSSQK